MIALGPIASSAGTTYTALQVQSMLQGPNLQMRWIFELLSAQLGYKADLTSLVDWGQAPTITHDSTQAVKRTLAFRMRSSSSVNPLQDLVRVRYEILAPDGGWLDWVIGLFMLTPPAKEIHEGYTWWKITAPDLSQLLSDAAFQQSTSIPAGAPCVGSIAAFAGNYGGLTALQTAIVDMGQRLPAAQVRNAGDSYLKAINDLLGAMVYVPVWLSGNVLVSRPQPDYTQAAPAIALDTIAGQAQIIGPLQEVADYTNAYNQILVTGQDPRRRALSAYYENRRADSPVSLLNWHPRLKVVNDSSLIDVTACQLRAFTEAQAAARVYSSLTVGTVPFPFFEDLDVVTLAYQSADEGIVRQNYIVMKTTHACHPSTATTCVLQRIVSA